MGLIGSLTGSDAAAAAKKGSKQVMAGQQKAMDLLNEYYEPLRDYKTSAFEQMAGFYGLGDPGQTQQMYSDVLTSPQYQQMVDVGQQGILSGASATGGLRSGNASQALAQSNQSVLQNLINQRLQGQAGFAAMDTGENTIADLIMQQAQTKGQGTTAAAQARQSGMGNLLNTAISAGSMAMGMPPMGSMMSGFSGSNGGAGSAISQNTFNSNFGGMSPTMQPTWQPMDFGFGG